MCAESSSGSIRSYRELVVWRRAIELAAECHRIAAEWGRRDRFGMGSQLRRSSASVHANIAEGNGRFSRGEYVRFLGIANGSLRETESHLLLAVELGLCSEDRIARALQLAEETGRMLLVLARRLRGTQR
jgi:four helix bundle protein